MIFESEILATSPMKTEQHLHNHLSLVSLGSQFPTFSNHLPLAVASFPWVPNHPRPEKKTLKHCMWEGLMYWQTHEMLRGKRLLQAPILRCMQQCLGCCLSQGIQVLELKGGMTRNGLGGDIPVFETPKIQTILEVTFDDYDTVILSIVWSTWLWWFGSCDMEVLRHLVMLIG